MKTVQMNCETALSSLMCIWSPWGNRKEEERGSGNKIFEVVTTKFPNLMTIIISQIQNC